MTDVTTRACGNYKKVSDPRYCHCEHCGQSEISHFPKPSPLEYIENVVDKLESLEIALRSGFALPIKCIIVNDDVYRHLSLDFRRLPKDPGFILNDFKLDDITLRGIPIYSQDSVEVIVS